MPDGIRWVGLDVHARESTFAVFDQATGEVITRRVVGRPHELLPWLRAVERPARIVFEAVRQLRLPSDRGKCGLSLCSVPGN
jgi:hypothetical protein